MARLVVVDERRDDLDVGSGGLGALLEAGSELLDQVRALVRADVPDRARSSDSSAAAAPTRNDPCSWAKLTPTPLGISGGSKKSRNTQVVSGCSARRRDHVVPHQDGAERRGRTSSARSASSSLDVGVGRLQDDGLQPVVLGGGLDAAGDELVEAALVRGRRPGRWRSGRAAVGGERSGRRRCRRGAPTAANSVTSCHRERRRSRGAVASRARRLALSASRAATDSSRNACSSSVSSHAAGRRPSARSRRAASR